MRASKRGYPMIWMPGNLSGDKGLTLAVELPAGHEMTPERLNSLLYRKILRQIEAEDSLEDAVQVAKMLLPNAWNLETGSAEDLAGSIMGLPEMRELIGMICWDESPRRVVQEEAREWLDEQCLMATLESLAVATE